MPMASLINSELTTFRINFLGDKVAMIRLLQVTFTAGDIVFYNIAAIVAANYSLAYRHLRAVIVDRLRCNIQNSARRQFRTKASAVNSMRHCNRLTPGTAHTMP